MSDWSQLSLTWKAELNGQINSLIKRRDQLDDCIGCGCMSISACQLRNPFDQLSNQGSGPQLFESREATD